MHTAAWAECNPAGFGTSMECEAIRWVIRFLNMTFRTTFQTYLRVTVLNVILISGGFLAGVAYRDRVVVQAQQQFEEISPGISTGTMAIGTLIAGRVATDQLSIQGVDILKLHENTLNYVSKYVGTADGWRGVIADSRVPRPLRLALPKQPEPKKEEPKKEGGKP